MKTTVINETTALLRVERMNVSSPHLSCEIVPPGSRRIQVCQNEIDVGCKFSCFSLVLTKYLLHLRLSYFVIYVYFVLIVLSYLLFVQ